MEELSHSKERHLAEPRGFSSWAKTGRIGGADTFVGMTPQEMNQVLTTLVAQKVSVVEADSQLSNYITDGQFEMELDLMRSFADAAHSLGLRVVWYFTSLEKVTPNGVNIDKTMYKGTL